jgi:hypothetical protein
MGHRARRRDERRQEAKIRQAEYDKLSPAEKLARLDAGEHDAKKQRAKLAQLAEGE